MKSQYPIEPKANGADANKPRKTAAATADVTPDSTRGFTSESEYQWFIQVTPNGEVRGASVTAQPACEASASTVVLEPTAKDE